MYDENGGFGENPKPTVKVWMGEGKVNGPKCYFLTFICDAFFLPY